MLAIVPIDARFDRSLVAAAGSVALLAAAESAHVARRMITLAPVASGAHDAAAVARSTGLSLVAVFVTGLVAQLDRLGRPFLVSLPALVTAFVITIAMQRPRADRAARDHGGPEGQIT